MAIFAKGGQGHCLIEKPNCCGPRPTFCLPTRAEHMQMAPVLPAYPRAMAGVLLSAM